MKKLFLLWLVSASCLRADLTITQQFQQGGQPPMDVVLKIKDGKIRMDPNPQVSVIMDSKTGESQNLIHSQKRVVTLSAEAVKKMQEAQMGAQPAAGPVEAPKPTGKKETINGYSCEEYETTVNGAKLQIWLTKDLPAAQRAMGDLAVLVPETDPMKNLLKNGELQGFPLKTVLTAPGGQVSSVVVKSLNEDPLSAKDFEVPAGYKAATLPAGIPGL